MTFISRLLRSRPVPTPSCCFEPLEGRRLLSVAVDPTFDPGDGDGEVYDHAFAHGRVQDQRMAVQADGNVVIHQCSFLYDGPRFSLHDAEAQAAQSLEELERRAN